jgi:membrane-associated phospholipid phosphatase
MPYPHEHQPVCVGGAGPESHGRDRPWQPIRPAASGKVTVAGGLCELWGLAYPDAPRRGHDARPGRRLVGGRVYVHFNQIATYDFSDTILNGGTSIGTDLPAPPALLLDRVHRFHGGATGAGTANDERRFLLPQAYPEGSPLHPSYGAGHATVAGACVTILKAWFNESWTFGPAAANELDSAVQPDAAGAALVATGDVLTVGGELNKLASNVSLGRNFAGVHWRSDYIESVRLGEEMAVLLLQEDSLRYNENRRQRYPPSFALTRFDGRSIRIERGRVIDVGAAYARIGSTPTGFLDG